MDIVCIYKLINSMYIGSACAASRLGLAPILRRDFFAPRHCYSLVFLNQSKYGCLTDRCVLLVSLQSAAAAPSWARYSATLGGLRYTIFSSILTAQPLATLGDDISTFGPLFAHLWSRYSSTFGLRFDIRPPWMA